MTITDAVKRYLSELDIEAGLSRCTLDAYRRDLEAFAGVVGDDPAALAPAHLQRFALAGADAGLSTTTCARRASAVRCFLRWLHQRGATARDLAPLVEAPRLAHRLPRTLNPAQAGRLIDAAETPRDRAALEMLYATGCRASELVKLTVGDVDLRTGKAVIRAGKGNKDREALFGGAAGRALVEYLSLRPLATRSDPLLASKSGRRLDRTALYRIVRTAAQRAGLGKVHPHTLRHSCASALLAGGASLIACRDQLGHADVATTALYLHLDPKHLKRSLRRFHPHGRTAPDLPAPDPADLEARRWRRIRSRVRDRRPFCWRLLDLLKRFASPAGIVDQDAVRKLKQLARRSWRAALEELVKAGRVAVEGERLRVL